MKQNPVVQLTDVSFRYAKDPVLDHISFDVPRGDFLGLIGPNGSGKTTLLKIMLGLLAPTTGQVTLFGCPIQKFAQRSLLGYVPQRTSQSAFKFPLAVEEVVTMVGGKRSVEAALQAVGLADQRHRLLSELSGGQQQRVFIARALATKPELLILDEPTVGVDEETQTQFYELLRRLNREHQLTLILVSHDIEVVAQEVKHVVCLNCQVYYHGQPQNIAEGVREKLYGKNVRFVHHH